MSKPIRQRVTWRALLEQVRTLYDFTMPNETPTEPAQLDPAQVQPVLVNLVKNAIEAGCATSDVWVPSSASTADRCSRCAIAAPA